MPALQPFLYFYCPASLGKTGEELSIIGFAGIVVMENSPSFASNIVAEAVDRGINYFDVAPTYGDAQERLGLALEPYRNKAFLACKQENWTRDGSAKLLDESLRLLRTDRLDDAFRLSSCDCGDPGPPCMAFANTPAVFAGRVIKIASISLKTSSGDIPA